MDNKYVVVNFRTPSGYKKIRIKKPSEAHSKAHDIRTGLLGVPMQSPMGMVPGLAAALGQGHGILIGGGGVLQPGTLETKIAGLKVVGSSYTGEDRIDVKVEGIDLPDIPYEIESLEEFDERGVKSLNIKYPLIPRIPKQGERVLSYAHIFYNTKINEPVYMTYEPRIDEKDEKLLDEIKDYIQEKLDINFFQLTRTDTIKYIIVLLEKAFDYFKVKERGAKRDVYKYYILRDFIGLGKIEPLMQDKQIEDISCDGVGIPLYVYHRDAKLGSLRTNIKFSSQDELDSFVNKLSERCGKTISVSLPLLDGTLPDGSRIQATLGSDIARHGSNFTIRMFTEKPLTPVDLINFGTCDLKMMAYYWFLVENGFSILVSGGTASGKTSLLNVLSLFIKPQMKIVSIEDSVTSDCGIVASRNGRLEKTTIGELIDKQIEKYGSDVAFGREFCSVNPENIKVFSLDKKGKVILSHVSSFIRHATKKDIYSVKTASGREIRVTADHSLFTLDRDGRIAHIKTNELKPGSRIAVPRVLPYTGNNLTFNLLEYLDKLTGLYLKGDQIKDIPDTYFDFVENKQRIRWWRNHNILPVYAAIKIVEKGFKFDAENLKIKNKYGAALPCLLKIDSDLLRLFGLWLAEGCYDKTSVIISNEDEECREAVRKSGEKFGIMTKAHSDGVSLMLNSRALKIIMKDVLGFSGNAFTRQIPSWVFDLPGESISHMLSGYFSGDSHVSKFEVQARSSSIQLLKDLQTLLLRHGIVSRISKFYPKDKTYGLRISSSKFLSVFNEKITFLQDRKCARLEEISGRKANHDTTDIVPLSTEFLRNLDMEIGGFNTKAYYSGSYIGREASSRALLKCARADAVSLLANSDVFWDEVKSIEKVQNSTAYVYDVSVPETENFVCENIIAHNTAELRLPHAHWVPEVARTPIAEEGKVDMFELLRESLRQRPDYIIVGEVRGKEAYVLFQQMATGHPGLSTIHSENFQKLMDRLISPPISLPPSLIQNLDAILFVKRVKQGRRYVRKVFSSTEVLGYDSKNGVPLVNEVFKWDGSSDKFKISSKSGLLKKVTDTTGMSAHDVQEELRKRASVLEWLLNQRITDYRKVGSVINLFYMSPDFLLERIGAA